jgi:protein-tyrosine-phosphatase
MNILFVCKYNKFRSQVAEAFFNKYNKNKSFNVKSAGLFQGSYPLDKDQVGVAKEFGILINKKPEKLNQKLINWADIIVDVADDVPPSMFEAEKNGKKLFYYPNPDTKTHEHEEIRNVISQIKVNIKELIKELGN